MTDHDDLAAFEKLFLALADKTRLRLLSLMTAGPASVGYLADRLEESQPKTSRHLAYLRGAGLVTTSRDGKWVYYEISTQDDVAVERILRSTLNCLNGTVPPGYRQTSDEDLSADSSRAHTYDETHMTKWRPNEIPIYLL